MKRILVSVLLVLLAAVAGFAQEAAPGGAMSAFASATEIQQRLQLAISSEDYPVTPGDVYRLTYRQADTPVTTDFLVESNYTINMKVFGTLNAAGMTFAAAEADGREGGGGRLPPEHAVAGHLLARHLPGSPEGRNAPVPEHRRVGTLEAERDRRDPSRSLCVAAEHQGHLEGREGEDLRSLQGVPARCCRGRSLCEARRHDRALPERAEGGDRGRGAPARHVRAPGERAASGARGVLRGRPDRQFRCLARADPADGW